MRYDSSYADLGVRDAEITAHAAFRRRLYDHDVVPEAEAAATALTQIARSLNPSITLSIIDAFDAQHAYFAHSLCSPMHVAYSSCADDDFAV